MFCDSRHADTIPGVGPETGGVVDFARFTRVLDSIALLEAADLNAELWTGACCQTLDPYLHAYSSGLQ